MKLVLAAAVTLVSMPGATAAQHCSNADKAALEQFDRMWGDATTRGDRAQLEMIYANDYAGTGLTSVQSKSEAIDGALRNAAAARANPQPTPAVTFDHYIISCTPTTATVTHRNAVTTTVDGKERTSYSRSVHVMEKRGGRWVVVGNAGHALTDDAIVAYMEEDWNQAELKRDYGWFERNLAPEAMLIDSRTGALESRSQMLAGMRESKEVTSSIGMSELSVRVDGNMAQGTGLLHVKGKDAQGRPFDRRIRFIDTFAKRDGRWVIVSSQGTAVP